MVDRIGSTCRICLSDKSNGVSIFDRQDTVKYSDLIKEYTGLDMVQRDNLPSTICNECTTELMVVIKFINKCRLSTEKLQEVLDINLAFYKSQSDHVKEEDVEDIPLSYLSTNIKEEDIDNFSEDVFSPYDDGEEVKTESGKASKLKKYKSLKTKLKKVKNKSRKIKAELKSKEFLKCTECGLSTASRSALIIHNRTHTGERPFQCRNCDKSFAQRGTLKEHIQRVHAKDKFYSQRSFVCDVCGKQCVKKNDLVIHMRVHTKEKPYQCSYCSQSFAQAGTLSQHIKLHTGEKPFACHICGKRFIAQNSLRRHMTVHSDERNFKCHICEKALKSSFALKKHMIFMHTSEKPNVCDTCGAAFADKTNLKAHIKCKHSELSGTCDLCNKAFSNLPEHMRVHTGDRPFECEICGKKFALQRSLTTHLTRHRNATKFACLQDKCTAAYSMQCQLDFHNLKVHSKNFPHICGFCSKGFYRSSDLTKHTKANYCRKYKIETMQSIDLKSENRI